jgi:hypothetical protein
MLHRRGHPQGLVFSLGVVGQDRLQTHDAIVHLGEFHVVMGLLGEILQRHDGLPDEVEQAARDPT